jgi:hypothetical protein
MDFIMRVWKKPSLNRTMSHTRNNNGIFLLYLVLLLVWPDNSVANVDNSIEIKHAGGEFVEENYLVSAIFKYHLGKEIQEALDHGIALQIDILLYAKQQRKWIWDTTIKSSTMSFRLEHHPLSGHYQVTNLDNYYRKHFQNLQSALDHIGLIKKYTLLERSKLNPDKIYIARIRARLNIQNLPAPLRLLAYVSSQWSLNCPWHEWIIQQ